jgi:hypothetical protein
MEIETLYPTINLPVSPCVCSTPVNLFYSMRKETHMAASVPKDDNPAAEKLLKDDRERNRHLTEAPDHPDTDPPAYPALRIQPIPPQQIEISTESR